MKESDGGYAPFRNTGKNYVFIASGMAEYLILQAWGVDFIAIQSDSIPIPYDISDKIAIVFEDNDMKPAPSGTPLRYRDANNPELANHFKLNVTNKLNAEKVIPIDFQNVLNRDLPKGYDLRDFVNEIDDWQGYIEKEVSLWVKNFKILGDYNG